VNDVVPIFIPPHSSHLVQPLGLSLFSVLKRNMKKINKADINTHERQTLDLSVILQAFQGAATTQSIVTSFHRVEIFLEKTKIMYNGHEIGYPMCQR
jgi:hypothetical protein